MCRLRSISQAFVENRLEVVGRNQPDSQRGNWIDVAVADPLAKCGCRYARELGDLPQAICEAATRVGN